MPSLPRPLAFFLKLSVTLLAVWLIARKVNLDEIMPVLREASPGWVVLSVATYFVALAFNALRWSTLDPNPGVSYRKYLYYVFVGSFLNLFSPSAALAEGARTYAFGKRYGGVQKNFAAVLFGRACGLIVQVALAAIFLVIFWDTFSSRPLLADARVDVGWLAVAGVILAALALFALRARLRPFFSAFASYATHVRLAATTLLFSLIIQLLGLWASYVLFLAVGADIRLWQIMVLPFIAQILLLVPISVGGIGVKEYLTLMLFAHFAGLPAERVLAATVLGYIPLILAALAGGAWMGARLILAGKKS